MTQTARGTPASECLSSSPYVLSPIYSLHVYPPFSTWQQVTGKIGQLEKEKLNLENSMGCVEDPRKIVLRKMRKKQLNDLEEETSKLADSRRGSRHQ